MKDSLIVLNEDIFNTRFPKLETYDYESMNDSDKEYFFKEYSLYTTLLVDYLIKNTSIKKIEELLQNSSNYDIPFIMDNEKDMYQYLCSNKLNYFYVRNNLYLDRLTEEEKSFLDNKMLSNNYSFDSESENFIKSTFNKVIKEKTSDDSSLNYGPSDSSSFYVKNGTLVIGFRYDEMVNDLSNDSLVEKYLERKNVISQICEMFEETINDELDVNVQVIEYSSSSIRNIDISKTNTLK